MKLYKRENYLSKIRGFYNSTDIIKVITGIRRCGKSSLMQMIMDELIETGVKSENIIYINLDKKGFRSLTSSNELEEIIDSRCNVSGLKYLFIDEIQNINDFETLINAYREEGDFSIFITGSNSYLLSGELVTKLTGRYLEFEMFTLSFSEFLDMKRFYNIPIDANLSIELEKYIINGGFPGAMLIEGENNKLTYVRGIVSEIIVKDVYKRIKVKNKMNFDLILNFIINNYGMTISLSSIKKAMAKGGNNINTDTIAKYINALLDAKIIYQCDRFDMKCKKYLAGEKKYYLSDLSFCQLTNPDSRINYDHALENIIFIYAKSKDYHVSIGRIGKLECDFILKDSNLNYSYVQVAYTILSSIETENREYRSLEMIRDNYPKYVITTDYLLQKRNGIVHVNLMEHLNKNKMF